MSLHFKAEYNTPEIVAALKEHGLETEKPSQLSDAFRLGFLANNGKTKYETSPRTMCNCPRCQSYQ